MCRTNNPSGAERKTNIMNVEPELIPCVDVPEGASGVWRVERFTVSDDDIRLFNLRCAFQPGGGRWMIKPGTYTRLTCGSQLVMSDTPAEKRDHREAVT